MVLFPKICVVLLSVLSARFDVKTFKIPNELLLSFFVTALFCRFVMLDAGEIGACLLGILVPFLILWLFFRFRLMGAGDVKLFCVLGAFMGPEGILWCMFWSFVCGGMIAFMNVLVFGRSGEKQYQKVHVAVLTVPAVLLWAGGIYG